LSGGAYPWGIQGFAATPGVDIQPPAPGIQGLHRKKIRGAALLNIKVDALNALLVKFLVLSKR
jgi:hypothetical protein